MLKVSRTHLINTFFVTPEIFYRGSYLAILRFPLKDCGNDIYEITSNTAFVPCYLARVSMKIPPPREGEGRQLFLMPNSRYIVFLDERC